MKKIDNELTRLAEKRRELLETLAPLLFDVSSAARNRQKLLREKRTKRKALRERIAELDGLIVSRVMELTDSDQPDSSSSIFIENSPPSDILLHQLKKSVELTRKPKENTNGE